jgi:hypothetical protein
MAAESWTITRLIRNDTETAEIHLKRGSGSVTHRRGIACSVSCAIIRTMRLHNHPPLVAHGR